jgi:hypothetical protein
MVRRGRPLGKRKTVMSTKKKSDVVNADIAMIAGIQKYLPNTTFVVGGQSMPAAAVVTLLQGRVDAANAIVTALAAWHAAVEVSDARYTATEAVVTGVRQTVLAMYAGSPAMLATFALSARKTPAPRTTEEKLVAAAKAKATRAARHTMSKKQKAAITGSLTGPIVVQVSGLSSTGAEAVSTATPASPTGVTGGSNGSGSSTPHP